MSRINLILISFVFLFGFFPAAVFAHADHESSSESGVLHPTAEIGNEFSTAGVKNGLSQEDVRQNNDGTIKQEKNRSVAKIVVASILAIMIGFIAWPSKSFENSRFLIVRKLRRLSMLWGVLVLAALLLITLTGIIISLWYLPDAGVSYESLQTIAQTNILSYIRNVHFWASDALLVLLIVHLTRVVFQKVPDTRKRVAYWIGLAMLGIIGVTLLFGTFLRSDQEAYEAYAHFWAALTQVMPDALSGLVAFFAAQGSALMRFFVFHSVILPLSILVLISAHAIYAGTFKGLAIQTGRVVKQYTDKIADKKKFAFPQLRLAAQASALLWALILMISFFPAPLMERAYNGLEVTKPPWYLLWVYGLENIFGMAAIIIGPLIVAVIFAAIPFFSKNTKKIDLAMIVYVLLMSFIVFFSMSAVLSGEMAHLQM